MSGTNTTPKKRSFGFDDILSILDGKKSRPPARPALPASSEAESTAATYTLETPEPPKVIALPEDHTLVPKLLSDIDQKNAEIIRLNNDLSELKYELREKEFKLNHVTLDLTSKDLKIKELQVTIEGLNTEISRLKAIQPQQPIIFTPAARSQVTAPQAQASEPVAVAPQSSLSAPPLQITQLMDAVQAAKDARAELAGTAAPVQADAAGARPISEQYNLKADVEEEDVATIFRRLAKARDEVPEESDNHSEAPRRPRSAKMYDL